MLETISKCLRLFAELIGGITQFITSRDPPCRCKGNFDSQNGIVLVGGGGLVKYDQIYPGSRPVYGRYLWTYVETHGSKHLIAIAGLKNIVYMNFYLKKWSNLT